MTEAEIEELRRHARSLEAELARLREPPGGTALGAEEGPRTGGGTARNATLLDLSDRMRDLTDPTEIAYVACEVLGRALGVSRVGYGLIDRADETITIGRDWNAPGIRTLAGTLHFRDYGSYIEDLKRGETVVFADARTDPRTAATAAALEAISARSVVNMPLVEQGRFVALLYANHAAARAWPDDDLALMREVADRVRDASERVRAEAARRESEEQFRVFAEAVPNQVWAARPDGFLYWFNPQVYAYSGEAQGTIHGITQWTRLVHPDDLAPAGEAWGRSLATGDVYETEFRVRRHDGAYRWFLVRAEPVRARDGAIARWVGTNTDIHDRKLAMAENVQDRDRLWSLSRDLMLVCDYGGVITAVNPSASRLLGWEQSDMLGRALTDFLHPDDLAGTAAEIGQIARSAATHGFRNRYRTADGTFRLIEWMAVPEGERIHAVGRDVTAEVEAAIALAASTAERDRLWETTNDLIGTAGLDGYLKAVNPAWTALLGWDEAELLARPFFAIIDPADHAATVAVVARLAAGERVTGFVDRVLRKDGTRRDIMWSASPGGDVFYIVGRDLTEQRLAEDALRQSQKMEAVGQLTGGLAHDFNNMLAGIVGSLELMQTRFRQGRVHDMERYIGAAQGAAKRAAALTHRLLAFSRRQTLDPKPTDMNRLIAGMEELVRRTVGPAVSVEVVAAGGLWPTLVDASQLENALLNLTINARDAMPEGGHIVVETGNRWLDARAAQERELEPGQYVSLCVSDNGIGMAPEVIGKAFDPFFTTKPIGEGTGLGLSMIYGFVKQSGGQVRIYSEIRKGTMVCLYLPRHHGDAADVAVEARAAPTRAEDGETVLVVDDEPTVRMLVTEVLEDLGYAAIEAADGASGLKVLQSDVRIDLLVTDVGLPGGLNGRQMADAARAKRPDLKVLFITGFAENAVLNHGHLAPGMQVLTKPFAMDTLAARMREMIGEAPRGG